ncbi:hypothetical protein ABW20_dc0106178 [Dactylellina cionopaga]|nr:hypothetical protein ABW20_dc0106178 [Dactylellina cionopaga]
MTYSFSDICELLYSTKYVKSTKISFRDYERITSVLNIGQALLDLNLNTSLCFDAAYDQSLAMTGQPPPDRVEAINELESKLQLLHQELQGLKELMDSGDTEGNTNFDELKGALESPPGPIRNLQSLFSRWGAFFHAKESAHNTLLNNIKAFEAELVRQTKAGDFKIWDGGKDLVEWLQPLNLYEACLKEPLKNYIMFPIENMPKLRVYHPYLPGMIMDHHSPAFVCQIHLIFFRDASYCKPEDRPDATLSGGTVLYKYKEVPAAIARIKESCRDDIRLVHLFTASMRIQCVISALHPLYKTKAERDPQYGALCSVNYVLSQVGEKRKTIYEKLSTLQDAYYGSKPESLTSIYDSLIFSVESAHSSLAYDLTSDSMAVCVEDVYRQIEKLKEFQVRMSQL